MRVCSAALKSSAPSSASAYCRRDSATAVLRTVFTVAMDWDEPTMRNSNLLPVNAKGEVRLRSVMSRAKRGKAWTPSLTTVFSAAL